MSVHSALPSLAYTLMPICNVFILSMIVVSFLWAVWVLLLLNENKYRQYIKTSAFVWKLQFAHTCFMTFFTSNVYDSNPPVYPFKILLFSVTVLHACV